MLHEGAAGVDLTRLKIDPWRSSLTTPLALTQPSFCPSPSSRLAGTDNGIVLHEGAVGVDVYNNFIHDYGFAGIRCGDYISQQGDCMLAYIFRNLVYSRKSNVSGDGDAAGIYFNTHWFNPGGWAMRTGQHARECKVIPTTGSLPYKRRVDMSGQDPWFWAGVCDSEWTA